MLLGLGSSAKCEGHAGYEGEGEDLGRVGIYGSAGDDVLDVWSCS